MAPAHFLTADRSASAEDSGLERLFHLDLNDRLAVGTPRPVFRRLHDPEAEAFVLSNGRFERSRRPQDQRFVPGLLRLGEERLHQGASDPMPATALFHGKEP